MKPTPLTQQDHAVRGTTQLLDDVIAELTARHGTDARISLGLLSDALKTRAYGVILLLMALPCCVPFIYGLPQIVAFPMLFLVGQLAAGRTQVWLPETLRRREFSVKLLAKTVNLARPWLRIFEKFARPRLIAISEGLGLRVLGALLLIPCASILVPLPLTNSVPGVGVAIAALGMIERDGLVILLGLLIGFLWVALLVIGGQAAVTFLFDFIRSLLA